jgi:hypothetical protein
MKKYGFLSLAFVSLLALSACGGAATIKNLATPSSIGMDATTNSTEFFFGSDQKVFPSTDCNSQIFRLLSDSTSYTQTHLEIDLGRGADVHQQIFDFKSESEANAVLALVKDSATEECNVSNALYSEYVYSPKPSNDLGDGTSGFTWMNSGSQGRALTCAGSNALYYESQLWVIVKGAQVLITSVSDSTCGDDDLPLGGAAKRINVGELAIKFALK